MDIAIIIGVSKYSDSANNLPGCKNDAKAIYEIIQKTDKFSLILYINDDETSAKTKELITNFISNHKGEQIDDLFFYYTGHGQFTNDEFFYMLSDYDPKKRKQTSLQNSEIDDLLRTLKPNLVIKVIDACQSGTSYIKETNILSKYLDETQKGFNKCYFLNSSLNTQASYQNNALSDFTASFINAIKEHGGDEIRYKDVIDFISDEFESNDDQTPFFVIQAEYTEKFCIISKLMRDFLFSFIPSETIKKEEFKTGPLTLTERVKLEAKDYVDQNGAVEMLEIIRAECLSFKLEGELQDLYKVVVQFLEDYQDIPGKATIGKWIKDNTNSYFAKATYERVEVFDTDPGYFSVQPMIGTTFGTTLGMDLPYQRNVEPKKQFKSVVEGFTQKIDIPFKAISIDILGNYPNLIGYNCKIIFLLSKKNIRLFYFITNYIEENWENKKLNTKDLKWVTSEQKITDKTEIIDSIKKIKLRIQEKIQSDLLNKFDISTVTEAKNTTPSGE